EMPTGGTAPAPRESPPRAARRCARSATGDSLSRCLLLRCSAPSRSARRRRSRLLRRIHRQLREVRQLLPHVLAQLLGEPRLQLARPLARDAPQIADLLQRHRLLVLRRRDAMFEEEPVLLVG